MTEAFFFLAVGMGSLAVLALWLHRSAAVMEPEAVSRVEEVLTAVQLEPPSRRVGERIFSRQDWELVASHSSRPIQRRFLRERKAIALAWLSETRSALQKLMRFHRKAVRATANLNPASEIRLVLGYLSFVLLCDALCAMVWLRGPFVAQKTVGYAFSMTDQLSYLSGSTLAGLDPACLSQIQSR